MGKALLAINRANCECNGFSSEGLDGEIGGEEISPVEHSKET